MKASKVYFTIISLLVLSSCDPAFKYEFSGTVVQSGKHEPIENAKLKFCFYPLENWQHWRTDGGNRDSLVVSEANGEFRFELTTLTMGFDSLSIKLSKEGFTEQRLISRREEWNRGISLNQTTFSLMLDTIEMESLAKQD